MEEHRKFGITDLLMLMAVLLWALNFSLIKITLSELPPLGFNGLRLSLSSLFLLSFLRLKGEGISLPRRDVWKIVSMGIVGNTIFQLLFIKGIDHTTASNTSIIMAMTPIFIALLSTFLKHEKISWPGWLGILLSIMGFYLVITQKNGGLGISLEQVRGDAMIFISNFCWAYYTVLAKPLLEKVSPLKLTAVTMSIGALFYLPFSLRDILAIRWNAVSWKAWGVLLFSSFFALSVNYIIWYASVKRIGNSKTAIYGNVTPVFAVLFAYFFLSEKMTILQLVGACIILSGVYLTRFGLGFLSGRRR